MRLVRESYHLEKQESEKTRRRKSVTMMEDTSSSSQNEDCSSFCLFLEGEGLTNKPWGSLSLFTHTCVSLSLCSLEAERHITRNHDEWWSSLQDDVVPDSLTNQTCVEEWEVRWSMTLCMVKEGEGRDFLSVTILTQLLKKFGDTTTHSSQVSVSVCEENKRDREGSGVYSKPEASLLFSYDIQVCVHLLSWERKDWQGFFLTGQRGREDYTLLEIPNKTIHSGFNSGRLERERQTNRTKRKDFVRSRVLSLETCRITKNLSKVSNPVCSTLPGRRVPTRKKDAERDQERPYRQLWAGRWHPLSIGERVADQLPNSQPNESTLPLFCMVCMDHTRYSYFHYDYGIV